MSSDYRATLVFGPNYIAAADGFREQGVPGLNAALDVESLRSAETGKGSIVLVFAHDMPPAFRGKDPEDWGQALMFGTLMGKMEMRFPDYRLICNEAGPASLLMLHWNDDDTAHALKVAQAIEESYADLNV
jgi:hypothetical protein